MANLIWTNASLEPKRKFKYLLTFSKFADVRFLAQTCDRPGLKVGASEHKYFDKTYYHPGKVTWDPNPLSVKLVDIQRNVASNVDTNEKLLQIFAQSGIKAFTADGEFRTMGKAAGVEALGDVKIRVLNSLVDADSARTEDLNDSIPGSVNNTTNGADVTFKGTAELWELHNAWLESVKPDALDYGAEDILTVTIQIRYDWAQFQSNGIGDPLLRVK